MRGQVHARVSVNLAKLEDQTVELVISLTAGTCCIHVLTCLYTSLSVLSDSRCRLNSALIISVCASPSNMTNQFSFPRTIPQQRCICRCSQVGPITQATHLSATRHTSPQVCFISSYARISCTYALFQSHLSMGKRHSFLLLSQPAHTKGKSNCQSPQQYQKRPLLQCQATSVAFEPSPLLVDSQLPKRR